MGWHSREMAHSGDGRDRGLDCASTMAQSDDRMLHRVGVVGDIHAEDVTLAKVLHLFASESLDAVLSVGDVVDGPGDADHACALLREHEVFTVRGNHDRWAVEEFMRKAAGAPLQSSLSRETLDWLKVLPATRAFQTPHGALLLCHGMGENDMATVRLDHEGYAIEANLDLQALLKAKRYRFVVSGHSHEPMVRRIGNITLINAGTLDRKESPVYSILDFETMGVEFYDVASGKSHRRSL